MTIGLRLGQPTIRAQESDSQITDFQLSEDGSRATKYFLLKNDQGINKRYSFTIYFKERNFRAENLEFLKKYSDAKVQTLGKMSVELGLGITYKGMAFSGAGESGKLNLTRYDGSVEKIDDEYFKKEKSTKNDKEQLIKMKLRVYKTFAYATKSIVYKNLNQTLANEPPRIREDRKKILESVKEIYQKNIEAYKDDVKVSIYYESFFKDSENRTLQELKQFIEEAKCFEK